jgi:ADP-ribosylglycohydrolase
MKDDETGAFLYTADTQMAVALAQGLLRVQDYENYTGVQEEFIAWHDTQYQPKFNRGPGNACMAGCRAMSRGQAWYTSGGPDAKGSGSLMRVFPVGALYRDNLDALIAVSADQSMMTHRHPTAVLAAVLGAYSVALLLNNQPPDETLVEKCLELAARWPKTNGEIVTILRKLQFALANNDDPYTVSESLGSGWIAEEALAIGLWSLVKNPVDHAAVIRRAVNFPGRDGSCDRDTVGAIAGAFAGAVVGIDGILPPWKTRIENRDLLLDLGEQTARKQGEFSKHTSNFTQSHGERLLEWLE